MSNNDDDDRPLVVGDMLTLNVTGRHHVRCTAVNVVRRVQQRLASDAVVVDVLPVTLRPNTHVSTDPALRTDRV